MSCPCLLIKICHACFAGYKWFSFCAQCFPRAFKVFLFLYIWLLCLDQTDQDPKSSLEPEIRRIARVGDDVTGSVVNLILANEVSPLLVSEGAPTDTYRNAWRKTSSHLREIVVGVDLS